METRDYIRAGMDEAFLALPQWLRSPFEALRENLTLLFDAGNDELARKVVAAIPQPAGWSAEQLAAFDQAKAGILSGIDALIVEREESDPLHSPEALAMLALAAERRAAP